MRIPRFALTLLAATVLVAAVAPVPASAVQTKTITVSKTSGDVKGTFGPIAANFPPAGVGHFPSACGHPIGTNRFERTCDNVPIVIEDPQLGPTEDYLVTIKVTWTPNEQVKDNEGTDTAGANDLDVYLYDDRQIRTRVAPTCAKASAASEPDNPKTSKDETDTATCWTLVGQSAGAVQPEEFKLFSPEPLTNYNLVIVNFTGPNISYTVEANMKIEGFDTPFEDLGPSFAGRNRATKTEESKSNFAPPVDLSGDDPPSINRGGGGTSGETFGGSDAAIADIPGVLAGGRSLDEVPILPDSDFASVDGSGPTDEFGAPSGLGGPGATRRIVAAGPVSGILVAFWLVLVPLALIAGGVFFLIRRSRNAFSFA